ncbi:LPS export ABC transporter permease LptG [Alteromonas sp. 5E99-2]|uniref:LPS export ABC transporter permease LptG n=1 Tax=Alteromonas sp. 5E99-2 TaxID=2817683 RepID=UPI001A99A5A8|nr:LPS export ABC transporter permease LptG [Alteromonas sp. 5E99-2]MBO1254357.1 LPS export ABC transporter permease LptG [Alteromonas sp. 5E99-2]
MITILDRYIARTLLSTVTLTLSILVGLSALIKFVEQLRKLGEGDYNMTVAALYVLLSLPREIEQFFPMATLLGALVGMGVLASSSELVVMQASGMSRWNIINSAMRASAIMIIVIMAVGEFITPISEAKAKQIRTEALSGGSLFASDELTWAKDGSDFVSIGQVITQNLSADVTVYRFADNLLLEQMIYAKQAKYNQDDGWQLQDVTVTSYRPEHIDVVSLDNAEWRSSLTPDKLGIVAVKPEALSIRGLNEYISYLDNNRQDSSRYELAFWRKLFQPLSVAVMVLMALSFIFGPLRSVSMGARVIMGVLVGFSFFISNEVFGPLSLVYQLPPLLGAVLPSVLFAGVAAFLLRR